MGFLGKGDLSDGSGDAAPSGKDSGFLALDGQLMRFDGDPSCAISVNADSARIGNHYLGEPVTGSAWIESTSDSIFIQGRCQFDCSGFCEALLFHHNTDDLVASCRGSGASAWTGWLFGVKRSIGTMQVSTQPLVSPLRLSIVSPVP